MDFRNYNVNSDEEIPLEVLRSLFIKGKVRVGSSNQSAKGSDTIKKVFNAIIALATVYLAFVAIFAPVWDSSYTIRSYELLVSGDNSIVNMIGGFFQNIVEYADDSIYLYIMHLVLLVMLGIELLVLIVCSIRYGIKAITAFFKNDTSTLELGFVKMFKASIAFLFTMALMRGSINSGIYFDVNPNFVYANVFAVLVIMAIGIARAVIRYRNSGIFSRKFKLHILYFISGITLYTLLIGANLYDFVYFSFEGLWYFLGNIPNIFSDITVIVVFVLTVLIDSTFTNLIGKFLKSFTADTLCFLTGEEELETKTRSFILTEKVEKKGYIFYAILFAIGLVCCMDFMYDIVGFEANLVFSANSNGFLFLFVITLTTTIIERVFKKKV